MGESGSQGPIQPGMSVDIRSLRIPDDTGRIRRMRVCTVWKAPSEFRRTPASARLIRTPENRVAVEVFGRNMGYVKIGKAMVIPGRLIVPFNCLSRKAVKALTCGAAISLQEEDGLTVGYEK